MKIIVTGGAGYIGSHTVVQLVEAGHEPVILDNFANSKPTAIDRIEELAGRHIDWYRVDLTDKEATREIFEKVRPDAVIHFAGLKAVGESVAEPLRYYEVNFGSTFSVVEAMQASGCEFIVFSSSATVYGEAHVPFVETETDLSALSPYGYTKLAQERILTDIAAATNIKVGLLRYFNPVGAHPSGRIGEDPLGIPNNLMPTIAAVAAGRREKLMVFGTDYPTPDGSCLRDYLHVVDLANGHVAALERLVKGDIDVRIWNFGTGKGTSVLELIHTFIDSTGVDIPYEIADRRPGDRADSYADASRAAEELGWTADRTVVDMCADTWRWQEANPAGYPDGEPQSVPCQ